MKPITPDDLIDRYDALLLDAYGVLVHSQGPLAGAGAFLERLRETGTDYLVVTNDASRLPETCASRYGSDGIAVPADRILTSGLLIVPHLRSRGLTDTAVTVLGSRDSRTYLERAGYTVVEPGDDRAEAVVVCDEAGYDFVDAVQKTLSMLVRAFDAGRNVELVCPNPDRLFPMGPDQVGFTGGAVAALFEDALRARYPRKDVTFSRLGKPHPALYERAAERLDADLDDIAMVGDQLSTDIKGARDFGIDSVLVTGGISTVEDELSDADLRPTWVMTSLVSAS